MSQPLAQPPKNEERTFNDWMYRLWRRITSVGGIPWNVVDKTGANITDIPTRHHDDLQYIPSSPVIQIEDDKEDQFFIPPPQTYDFDHITFPAKTTLGNMAHVYTLAEYMNYEWSAGVVDGAVLTDNGNGTISLSAATAVLRASTDPHTTLYGVYVQAQLNIALTDNATNYVYLDWNAGNPTFNVSTSVTSFNCLDKCIAYVVHRLGTVLHWIDAREQNVDFNRKYRQFSLKLERFRHAFGGTALGSNGLAVTLTAGTFYFMVQQIDHIAFDTSVAGTANANVFALWYQNGIGGWTEVANSKVIDTTLYDAGTGTPATLGNNKFGVTWFYVINDSPSELHAIMGEAQYASLADAAVATPPASVPSIIDGLGSLVGYVAYEKSNTVFNAVYSAFTQEFASSAATTHNGLSGLQGGTVNQYYHLTATQAAQVNDFISRGSMGIPGMDGEDGQDGAMGPPGVAGAAGVTGPQGPMGPQGMVGIGLDGEDGDDGMPIPGPQGPQGPAGTGGGLTGTKGIGILKWGALNIPQNATNYASGVGIVPNATETKVAFIAPRDMLLSELRVSLNSAVPASNSLVATVRAQYADTAITCTVGAGATSASDTTHSVEVLAGTSISIKLVASATFTSTIDANITLKCSDPTGSYGVTPLCFTSFSNGGIACALGEPGVAATPGASNQPIAVPPCYIFPTAKGLPATTGLTSATNTYLTYKNGVEFLTGSVVPTGAGGYIRTQFVEGDTLYCNETGAPTAEADAMAYLVESSTTGYYPPTFTALSSNQQAQNTTFYMGGYATTGNSATENEVQIPMPACTVKNLRITSNTAVSSTTTVITIRKNGVATALTATLTSAGTYAADFVDQVTFAAGDLLSIQCVSGATTGSRNYNASFEMVA